VHHELPIRALLDHAASRRLRRYRLHHGRSHLVLYENRPGSPALGRARLAYGRRRGQK
jgi:hypothetical protein